MQVQSTLLSSILQHLPWKLFDRAVASHQADKGSRTLNARSHLVALLIGQLIEAHGLRDIEAVMAAHAPALARRRIEPARRSTLSDANTARSSAAFEALIPALLTALSPTQARTARNELRLIDSTLIRPGARAEWAAFQAGQIAAKVHLVYDPKAALPVFYEISAGNVNDITIAKTGMPIEPGATYIFDLGYYDFGFWATLDKKGCRFVTRLKKNTPVTIVRKNPRPADRTILADQIVRLPERQSNSRKNPFSKAGRLIAVKLPTGKTIRIFSNDLNSPPEAIAALYKTRWQIETFFRWLKQNLRIRHFHGTSVNAVKLQVTAAIITYLLLKIVHAASRTKKTIAVFIASARQALFLRIPLQTLVERIDRRQRYIPPEPCQIPQLEFAI